VGSGEQNGGETATGVGRDESNITLVMVVIIVVFIICELPASANQVSSTDNICRELIYLLIRPVDREAFSFPFQTA